MIQFIKFAIWRLLNFVGPTKLSSNEDFKDIAVELKDVFIRIVPFVRLWLIMSTGLCSAYIFYYEEGSYLGVSYIVPLGICIILMVTFSIRSVIEHDISSNKNLNDHSMVTVNHVLNTDVQRHLKSDAWVVGTYQSFVSFIFFVFVLSSFCNLGPKYLDITLPQFLLSNDKYFWILFKSQDLRYIFFSNMFVLYILKIVVQASMNPFFSMDKSKEQKNTFLGPSNKKDDEWNYKNNYSPCYKNRIGYLFMKYAIVQLFVVVFIQYWICSFLFDYFQSIFYTYLVFIVLECMKFLQRKFLKMAGVNKLFLNEMIDKIVVFFQLFIVMGLGTSSLYIFYYEKSYLGVHHYVPLGIFVVIGLVFLFQFLTAYELANKEPEDYGYFAVIHYVNVALEKYFKTDAWVIKYYQSFVYVLMFLSSLSSLCEFCPIFLNITLPPFLSEYLELFKANELRWFLLSNMYALVWVKLFYSVSMNPLKRSVQKAFKKSVGVKTNFFGGTLLVTAVAIITGVYADIYFNLGASGELNRLMVYPDALVQFIQECKLDLIPFRDANARDLAFAIREGGHSELKEYVVFDQSGYMLSVPTLDKMLEAGIIYENGVLRNESTLEWGYRTCWGILKNK